MKSKIAKKLKRAAQSMALFALSALMLLMSFGTPAFAALEALGPLDTVNSFPTAIVDTNGVALAQCLDPFHCAAATADLPVPTSPLSFPDNFFDEIFWYMAESMFGFASPNGGAGSALLVMAIEGAYGGGAVLDGDQIMFSRIRFRADGLIPNTDYVVTHPYGTINVTAGADGTVFVSDDCGMAIPGDPTGFVRILDCPIGPFLQADLTNPPLGEFGAPVGPPPAGFIASIADENRVTGSPFGTNFFKVTGPGLGLNGVSTDIFSLVGKISNAPQLSGTGISKATYTRPLIGPSQAQVFATATETSQMSVSSSGAAASPLINSVIMEQKTTGGNPLAVPPVPPTPTPDFFVNADLMPNIGGGLSKAIIITDSTLNPPANALSQTLVDVLNITEATYNQATNILTVSADSSDKVTTGLQLVVLNVPAPGNVLVGGSLSATLNAPIDRVTVQSNQGGVATANVVLVGPGSTNFLVPNFAAPVANAGLNKTVFLDTRVDMSAAASTGVIATYAWTQIAGPAATIGNANTSDANFFYPTPPVTVPPTPAPTYTFQVSVVGPGGVSSALVSIDAQAAPPVVPTIEVAEVKLGKDEWQVDGIVNNAVPGSVISALIVTDALGTKTDILAASFQIPADVNPDGTWQWGSKDIPVTTGLVLPWTIHAVSSTGAVGPAIPVAIN